MRKIFCDITGKEILERNLSILSLKFGSATKHHGCELEKELDEETASDILKLLQDKYPQKFNLRNPGWL